jgi:hypothetical protein
MIVCSERSGRREAQGSGDAGMAGQGQTSQGLFAPGRERNSRSGAVTTVTLAIQVAAQIGGSRAPTVASDCDAASLAFQNVCFLPNLAQADDHRAKASERYCAR